MCFSFHVSYGFTVTEEEGIVLVLMYRRLGTSNISIVIYFIAAEE
jgi:hypothetical protein